MSILFLDAEGERTDLPQDRIRTVTLGSNFIVRIFCQVSFCWCKISGLELIFSLIDLDFRAVDQLVGIKLCLSNLYHDPWHGVICGNIQL